MMMSEHDTLPAFARVVVLFVALFITGGILLFTGRVAYQHQAESTPVVLQKTLALTRPDLQLPVVSGVYPTPDEADVILGAEDPIRVTFASPAKDFFMDFRFDPPLAVTYEYDADKTEFKLLPVTGVEPGKTYDLSVFARPQDEPNGEYRFLTRTRFTTLSLPPEKWSKDKTARLTDAKRFATARIATGKYIDINLAVQVMTLFEDGKALDVYLISSGQRGMDTPKGEFAIHNKARRPWSKQYSLYMPYWMALTSDGKYGIHELPEWPGGYKEGVNHLGIPVSHGCVRLGVGPAERVWNWAEEGTPVVIH